MSKSGPDTPAQGEGVTEREEVVAAWLWQREAHHDERRTFEQATEDHEDYVLAAGELLAALDRPLPDEQFGRANRPSLGEAYDRAYEADRPLPGDWVYCETEGVVTEGRCTDDCGCKPSAGPLPGGDGQEAERVVANAIRRGQPHDGSDLDCAVDEDAEHIVKALRGAGLLSSPPPAAPGQLTAEEADYAKEAVEFFTQDREELPVETSLLAKLRALASRPEDGER